MGFLHKLYQGIFNLTHVFRFTRNDGNYIYFHDAVVNGYLFYDVFEMISVFAKIRLNLWIFDYIETMKIGQYLISTKSVIDSNIV